MKTNTLPAAQTGTSVVCMQEGQPHCMKCTYMSIYYGQTLVSCTRGNVRIKNNLGGRKAKQQHTYLKVQPVTRFKATISCRTDASF